ncbi:hypothetical protein GGR51DRAFT_526903 [Nemania sp. FL0031]|nr:hypothetical protein GGR51DRAFT_526903 [Nemania sp. FL0031]
MSDQSDRDEDLMPDEDGYRSDDDSGDESATDRSGMFFDMEAEESDGDDGDEDEDDDDDVDENEHDEYYRADGREDFDYYDYWYGRPFPQFSRLPPELRAMIWATVDLDLKAKGRVFDFTILPDSPPELWDTGTLAWQTAPARTVLSINKESRSMALTHYPDAIKIRLGQGEIRFNGSTDVILLRGATGLDNVLSLGLWCDNIQYIGFDILTMRSKHAPPDPLPLDDPPLGCRNLKAVFYCFEASSMKRRKLLWTVSDTAHRFNVEATEQEIGLVEDYEALYCWPDTTLHESFADVVSEEVMKRLPDMPAIGSIPTWPMAQFSTPKGFSIWRKARRLYEYIEGGEEGDQPLLESSEGESYYESELDDYELDDFVVDNINGYVWDGDTGEGEDDDEDDIEDEEEAWEGNDFDQGPNGFNGFSPLEGESDDDEVGSGLPNATIVTYDRESPEDDMSDAAFLEEEQRDTARSNRRKRRIVSSDDEDDGEGGTPSAESQPPRKKRLRVVLSDSEEEEDGGGDNAEPEAEKLSRLKKRARVVLSDTEDDEGEEHQPSKRGVAKGDEQEDEDEEDEEEDEENEDDEDEDEDEEEDAPASKPLSLMQRLRQFRSDVRVSPENESPNSGEDDEEEHYEDDEEQGYPDAEFPESGEEDDGAEGW